MPNTPSRPTKVGDLVPVWKRAMPSYVGTYFRYYSPEHEDVDTIKSFCEPARITLRSEEELERYNNHKFLVRQFEEVVVFPKKRARPLLQEETHKLVRMYAVLMRQSQPSGNDVDDMRVLQEELLIRLGREAVDAIGWLSEGMVDESEDLRDL
jgi:hypothetical protein